MPDNPIPAPKSTPGAEPAEFNFDESSENPRIKRRSLKATSSKPNSLIKPEDSAVSAARELEREAPPRTESPAAATQTAPSSAQPKNVPVIIRAAAPTASTSSTTPPPKTTPATGTSQTTANGSATTRPSTTTSTSNSSPHGTRPATLYYSTPASKAAAPTSAAKTSPAPASKTTPASASTSLTSKAATTPASSPSPMKTVSGSATTSSTTPASAAAASVSSSATRAASTGAPRTSPQPDYRANVERQSREQKSVGSILSYVVYGLLFIFLVSAILAGYGAKTVFDRLHDQSVTVGELDQKYSDANKELNAKLVVTQDTLTQVQAQTTREQDLILKQQEEINALKSSLNDSIAALKSEKAIRAQDSAAIRAKLKDLENRSPFSTNNR